MTRRREPAPKTAQDIIRDHLPEAEGVLKDALSGVDVLDNTLKAAIFIVEMAARYPTQH